MARTLSVICPSVVGKVGKVKSKDLGLLGGSMVGGSALQCNALWSALQCIAVRFAAEVQNIFKFSN